MVQMAMALDRVQAFVVFLLVQAYFSRFSLRKRHFFGSAKLDKKNTKIFFRGRPGILFADPRIITKEA
jgi:hypothetical protein